MRSDPKQFSTSSALLSKRPRSVIEVSFADDNSVLWYFTSHDDIELHSGANVVPNCVKDLSVTSQTLNPDTAVSSIGAISFDLIDKGSQVTAALSDQLALGRTARMQRVRVFYGFEGFLWDDPAGAQSQYALVQTQLVTQVEFKDGAYHFSCSDIQREMRQDIFTLFSTNLSSTLGATRLSAACLAGDGTLNVVDTTNLPASGSGIIREVGVNDKDAFAWTGKTAKTLTGVTGVLAHAKDATVCDATVNVYDTSGLEMVAHGTSYSDSPSTTVGYVLVDKEVVSYTAKTSTTLTGCVRGALATIAVEHVVDPTLTQDRRPEVQEYVYLELPAVDMAYRILTGKDRLGNSVMPTNWHLGIPTTYVRLSDFTGIGDDLWKPSDDLAGFPGYLQNIEKIDGKKFLETEIALLLGCFMPIYADGTIGFRRQTNILAGAAYSAMIDETNVVSWGALQHDYQAIHNIYEIQWNWEPFLSKPDFTRKTDLVELSSALLYKNAPIMKLKFRLLHGSRHSSANIAQRFDAMRDRYSGPPQRLTINGLHSLNGIEVGDVVRVRLDNVRDFAAPGGGGPIDRSFEVQNVSVNWMNGQLSVQLFASSRQPGPLAATTDASVLTHAWYSGTGTQLVNGTGGLTVSGTSPIHISGSGTLSGNADMTASGAVYWMSGDVQIDAGCTINLTQNVQLRIEGHLQNNGTINGKGAGLLGGAQLAGSSFPPGQMIIGNGVGNPAVQLEENPGLQGYLGTTEAGGGLFALKGPQGNFRSPPTVGKNSAAPELNLAWDGTTLIGIPTDMRGTSGSSGGNLVVSNNGSNVDFRTGGAGGNGGASLLLICRGFAQGGSAVIDLSGADGSVGGQIGPDHAGSGAGGAPGVLHVLLDGSGNTATGLTEAQHFALYGKTPITGMPVRLITQFNFPTDFYSDFVGTGDGSLFDLPDLSGPKGGMRVSYIPGNPTVQADPHVPFIYAFDVVSGTLTATQIAQETLTGGSGGNIAPQTITGSNLVNLTVTATQIANLTITAAQIANATITGTQIASATITGTNIASATITSSHIVDATIVSADIASATILGSNIASATIAAGNIVSATITATQIANVTITASQIANLTITATQIANATITGAQIASATITGGLISSATITGGLIASATITGSNIVGGTITGSNIASATITASNIVASTITANEIAAATITAAKLNISQLSAISADIGDITAGSIRGVNVNASSHTTKGSYITSALSGGEATVNVRNTSDFSSGGGAGVILDTTNDRNSFSYTGKTAGTLTGCSGVLAHNDKATILPLGTKEMVIDGNVNEMRFYGNRGDGTVEELAAIGVNTLGGATAVAFFGSLNGTIKGVYGRSSSDRGVVGESSTSSGVLGLTASGRGGEFSASGSGTGVFGNSASGYGAEFDGNATCGNLLLPDCNGSTFPTNKTATQLAMAGGRLYYSDGSHWYPLTMPYFESSEQTITASTLVTVAHGLTDGAGAGRLPKNVRCVIRCKTAELGYSVGDEVEVTHAVDGANNPANVVFADATNVYVGMLTAIYPFNRTTPTNLTVITLANWKFVLYAS